jgi:thymidylate kinase
VELVGPAGAGKTTLVQALDQRSKKILIGDFPYFRRAKYIPFFVRSAFLMVPTLLRLYQTGSSKWPTRREIAWMSILMGWPRSLGRRASEADTIVVLDQGPVYLLTELCAFGSECLNSRSMDAWWNSMFSQWAATLDMVVWLDAADAILAERIHTRPRWHLMKGRPDQEAFEFLARYRKAYKQVLAKLTANANGPSQLCLDTSQESINEIIHRILVALDQDDGESKVSANVPQPRCIPWQYSKQ